MDTRSTLSATTPSADDTSRPTQQDDLTELPRALWPHSKRAVLKLAMMMPLARHRAAATPAQAAVAHLVAASHEDCGACVRIAKRAGLAAGLDRATVQAVLDGRVGTLAEELRLVHRLASEVVAQSVDATETARDVARQLSEEALADLALAIAIGRFFPTAKRAMGLAVSCSVGGTDV